MPLLRAEADKLSQNQVVQGIIEEIITANEMFALLPFVKVDGKAFLYKRENTLPTVAFLDVSDNVPESAGTFTEVVTKLRILAGGAAFAAGVAVIHRALVAISCRRAVKSVSIHAPAVVARGRLLMVALRIAANP
jgi:hypothetical protein